jgi:Ni/Co efflux regulator RcnB
MKTLVSAALALSLLGIAGTANAAPFYGPMHGPVYHREAVRFAPGHHVWVRGERFVPGYGRFVVVDDWRAFRLARPAFGAHWVRAGDDFLLVSNRTGTILQVVERY